MVTIHDKGSDNVRLRSGSCHVMTKKTSIWVPICKEKRMKNSGESDFRHSPACPLRFHKTCANTKTAMTRFLRCCTGSAPMSEVIAPIFAEITKNQQTTTNLILSAVNLVTNSQRLIDSQPFSKKLYLIEVRYLNTPILPQHLC